MKRKYYRVCFDRAPISVPLPLSVALEAMRSYAALNPERHYHVKPVLA